MPTPIWLTGLEHGVMSASGTGLFDVVQNAPTIDSTIKRTGSYSIRFYKTGTAAACFVDKNTPGSPTYLVGRFYVYFTTLPSAGTTILRGYTASGVSFYITYNPTGTRLEAYCATGGTQTGPTVTTGVWYRVEFRFYCGGTTYTIDWQTATGDGSPTVHTQATATGQTASTFSTITLGSRVSCTLDMYEDDVYISSTSGDYPIGAGGVVGLSPNAAGTSNPGTGVMQDNGSTDINDSTNPAYVELDDVPISGTTDYIKQVATGTGNYAEVAFADTTQTTIHGAMGILAYMSASASANEGACVIVDEDSTLTEIWGNPTTRADYSETSMFYKSAKLPAPAGGWDQAAVNALKARIGYSNDISPVPYWENLMIEVAYAAVTAYTLSCVGGSYSVTGTVMTPKRDGKIVPEAGSYTLTGTAAGVHYGRAIDADAGSYIVTGETAGLLRAAKIIPESGAYALTGQAAGAYYGRKIFPESGEYGIFPPFGGINDIGLYLGRKIFAEDGAYLISGQDAATIRAARIAAAGGAYDLSGQDAATKIGRLLSAEAGGYVITGQEVTLVYTPGGGAYVINAEGGAYSIVGPDLGLRRDAKIGIDPGSYVISGQAASVLLGRMIDAGAGSYAISGQQATLLRNAVLGALGGSYVLTGGAATLGVSFPGILKRWDGTNWVTVGVLNGNLHDHVGGDGAPITEDAISLSDVTTLDVSTSKHGLCPKAPDDQEVFLRGDASWAGPTGGSPGALFGVKMIGRYYHLMNQLVTVSTSTIAGVPDNLNCYPFVVPKKTRFDKFMFRGGAALANAVVRCGIYDTDPTTKLPGNVVYSTGEVDVSGAAQNYDIDCDVTLEPGLYWYFKIQNNAKTFLVISQTNVMPLLGFTGVDDGTAETVYALNTTYGEEPDPHPGGGTFVYSANSFAVAMRVLES